MVLRWEECDYVVRHFIESSRYEQLSIYNPNQDSYNQ